MTRITRTLFATAFAFLALWILWSQLETPADLPRSTPEQQGIASSAVADFVAALDSEIEDVHGLMVLRHGHVVAEGWWAPYRPDSSTRSSPLSKSFTSTA